MIEEDFTYVNSGKKLFEFEDRNFEDLSKIQSGGWNAWRILKSDIFFDIIYRTVKTNDKTLPTFTNNKVIRIGTLLISGLKTSFKLFYYWVREFFQNRKILFITLSINKTLANNDNKLIDIVVDGFITSGTIRNYIYLEIPDTQKKYIHRAMVKTDFFTTEFDLFIFGLFKLFKFTRKFLQQSLRLEKIWNTHFNNQLYKIDSEKLKAGLQLFYAEYCFYKVFFKIVKPKLIIFNDQMATGRMAAAKRLGIRTVELQHGLMDEYYPQYQLHPKFLGIKNSLPISDKIGVFGMFHKNQLISKKFYSDNEISILGKYDVTLKHQYINRFSAKSTILFVTQGLLLFEQTQKDILELISKLDFDNFFLIIKIHPLETKELSDWYFNMTSVRNEGLKILQKEYNINQLFDVVDYVIGYNSTVLLEAVYHRKRVFSISDPLCPNGIFSITGDDYLLERNIEVCSSTSSILEKIAAGEQHISNTGSSEYLYANGYFENIKKLINEEFVD